VSAVGQGPVQHTSGHTEATELTDVSSVITQPYIELRSPPCGTDQSTTE